MAKKKAKRKTKKVKTAKKAGKPALKKKAPKARRAKAKKAAPKAKARKPKAKAGKPKAAAPQAPLPWRHPLPGEAKIGMVDDYFSHIGVIVLNLEAPLAVGDKIHVRGHTTDLSQPVESLQIAHQGVERAEAGAPIGLKVNERCRKGDYVYKAG